MNILGLNINVDHSPSAKVKWTRRAIILGTANLMVIMGGAAYATWTANGSGNGSAKAGQINFTVGAVTGSVTNTLIPGSTAGVTTGATQGGDLVVHINNTNNFAIKITGVQQYGLITAASGLGTCTSDAGSAGSAGTTTTAATPPTVTNTTNNTGSGVYVGTTRTGGAGVGYFYAPASPITVPASSNADVTIANAVSMDSISQTGCQTASFTIPVQVQASL